MGVRKPTTSASFVAIPPGTYKPQWLEVKLAADDWFAAAGLYIFAKVLEYADAAIFSATGNVMSGHALKHLAAALAETHEMSKKQAETVLGDFVGNIVKHLKKGERIRIVGLGILQVRKRAARMGRNPATGETIQIKASKKVAFRAAKELKEAV